MIHPPINATKATPPKQTHSKKNHHRNHHWNYRWSTQSIHPPINRSIVSNPPINRSKPTDQPIPAHQSKSSSPIHTDPTSKIQNPKPNTGASFEERDVREAMWSFSDGDRWGWIGWATVRWKMKERPCEASAMEMGERLGEASTMEDGVWCWCWCWEKDGVWVWREERANGETKNERREENRINERDEREISDLKGIINFFFFFFFFTILLQCNSTFRIAL